MRIEENALRVLSDDKPRADFSSNDYLGLSRSESLWQLTHTILDDRGVTTSGSTGSRLISGNHRLYGETEEVLEEFYRAEAALVFNSGYDANTGFFASVPQRGDIVLFDEYIHASIRDGLRMGNARSFKFVHNDLQVLEARLKKFSETDGCVYVVTESVFSMDGDSPDLAAMAGLCEEYGALLVVDEAHAVGVLGEGGRGLASTPEIRERVFARIVTFGKAPGVHGAAILGSRYLKSYLVNFARSLIYTTALPPHALASILAAHQLLVNDEPRDQLQLRIEHFKARIGAVGNHLEFKTGASAISTVLVPGNDRVRRVAENLIKEGFGVKAILSPTVPKGQERLRICLHSWNSLDEIDRLIDRLIIFVGSDIENV